MFRKEAKNLKKQQYGIGVLIRMILGSDIYY